MRVTFYFLFRLITLYGLSAVLVQGRYYPDVVGMNRLLERFDPEQLQAAYRITPEEHSLEPAVVKHLQVPLRRSAALEKSSENKSEEKNSQKVWKNSVSMNNTNNVDMMKEASNENTRVAKKTNRDQNSSEERRSRLSSPENKSNEETQNPTKKQRYSSESQEVTQQSTFGSQSSQMSTESQENREPSEYNTRYPRNQRGVHLARRPTQQKNTEKMHSSSEKQSNEKYESQQENYQQAGNYNQYLSGHPTAMRQRDPTLESIENHETDSHTSSQERSSQNENSYEMHKQVNQGPNRSQLKYQSLSKKSSENSKEYEQPISKTRPQRSNLSNEKRSKSKSHGSNEQTPYKTKNMYDSNSNEQLNQNSAQNSGEKIQSQSNERSVNRNPAVRQYQGSASSGEENNQALSGNVQAQKIGKNERQEDVDKSKEQRNPVYPKNNMKSATRQNSQQSKNSQQKNESVEQYKKQKYNSSKQRNQSQAQNDDQSNQSSQSSEEQYNESSAQRKGQRNEYYMKIKKHGYRNLDNSANDEWSMNRMANQGNKERTTINISKHIRKEKEQGHLYNGKNKINHNSYRYQDASTESSEDIGGYIQEKQFYSRENILVPFVYSMRNEPMNQNLLLNSLMNSKAASSQYTHGFDNAKNMVKFHETLKNSIYNNANTKRNSTELIQAKQYPVEEHKVTTNDGYILQMIRVTGSPTSQNKTAQKPVVFLMHGFLGSSDDWLLMESNQSFAYLLADAGYDVWLGNARGNKYSRHHVEKKPEQPEFWQFSNDEIALLDLPAMIDYALKTTQQSQLFYVGFSQGNAQFFALASSRPEYNRKIKTMYALSPMAYLKNTKSPLVNMFSTRSPFYGLIEENLENVSRNGEFSFQKKWLDLAGQDICMAAIGCEIVCSNVNFIMSGVNVQQLKPETAAMIVQHMPAGGSMRQMIQLGQATEDFRMFDYGIKINQKKYGTSEPPSYNMKLVSAPVEMFSSKNDWLAATEDVEKLEVELPNVRKSYKIKHSYFTNMDFIAGRMALEMYQNIINSMDTAVKGEQY